MSDPGGPVPEEQVHYFSFKIFISEHAYFIASRDILFDAPNG